MSDVDVKKKKHLISVYFSTASNIIKAKSFREQIMRFCCYTSCGHRGQQCASFHQPLQATNQRGEKRRTQQGRQATGKWLVNNGDLIKGDSSKATESDSSCVRTFFCSVSMVRFFRADYESLKCTWKRCRAQKAGQANTQNG